MHVLVRSSADPRMRAVAWSGARRLPRQLSATRAPRRLAPGAAAGPVLSRARRRAPGSTQRQACLPVAAHEQVEPPGDGVEQQALVGADAVLGEGLVEIEVEEYWRQRVSLVPAPWRPAGAARAVFRLQPDDQLVGLCTWAREDAVRRGPELTRRSARRAPPAAAGAQVPLRRARRPSASSGSRVRRRDEGLGGGCPRYG